MIKLLICDDDEVILEGIEKCVDWNQYGIEVIATANHGKKALDILEKNHIDLLFTDVKMPYYTGLEVLKKAKEINPEIIAVMLSGYNDFEYARKAIKLGALDFISKPVELEELDQIIKKAVEFYQKQKGNQNRNRKGGIEILLNAVDEDEIKKQAEAYHLTNKYFRLFMLELDEFSLLMDGGSEELKYEGIKKYKELLAICMNEGFISLPYSEYTSMLCVLADDDAEIEIKTSKMVKWVREFNRKDIVICQVTLAVSEKTNQYEKLYVLKKQAFDALRFKFMQGIGSVIMYGQIKELLQDTGGVSLKVLEIPFPMKIKERSDIDTILADMETRLKAAPGRMEFIAKNELGNWVLALSEALTEYNIKISEIFDNPMEIYENISNSSDLQGILKYFKQIYTQIYEYYQAKKNGKYIDIITVATKYMKNNYMNSGLSIEEVAEHVNMSVGYFSLIFHNETNQTFSNYLMIIRMKKAKELLENTNMKLLEISKMAGYENGNYFSTVFKKYTGMTPSLYRENIKAKSGS